MNQKKYTNVFAQATQHPKAEEFYQEAVDRIKEEECENTIISVEEMTIYCEEVNLGSELGLSDFELV